MKARKSLEIVFPTSFHVTMFIWDRIASGYEVKRIAENRVLVAVQQRKARQRIANDARFIYDAQTRTLVE